MSAAQAAVREHLVAIGQRGNETRSLRCQLKRDLHSGRMPLSRLLVDPPAWAEPMALVDLLEALPSFGQKKVEWTMEQLGLSPTIQLGTLDARRRLELLQYLRDHHPYAWQRWLSLWRTA